MAKSAKKPSSSGGDSWRPLLLASMVAVSFILFSAVMILLAVAMLPTVVAYFTDRTPQRYSAYCVGGMNFCGTFPSLMQLWDGANSIATATAILTDVFSLIIIYGAAAFGWMVYMSVPPVIGAIVMVAAQRRIQRLRAEQRQLIGEWGDGLAVLVGANPTATQPSPKA